MSTQPGAELDTAYSADNKSGKLTWPCPCAGLVRPRLQCLDEGHCDVLVGGTPQGDGGVQGLCHAAHARHGCLGQCEHTGGQDPECQEMARTGGGDCVLNDDSQLGVGG